MQKQEENFLTAGTNIRFKYEEGSNATEEIKTDFLYRKYSALSFFPPSTPGPVLLYLSDFFRDLNRAAANTTL